MIIFIHLGPNRRDSPFTCVCLHSDRAPPERKANLQKFKVLVTIYFILEIFVNYLMRFLGNQEYLLTNDCFLFCRMEMFIFLYVQMLLHVVSILLVSHMVSGWINHIHFQNCFLLMLPSHIWKNSNLVNDVIWRHINISRDLLIIWTNRQDPLLISLLYHR